MYCFWEYASHEKAFISPSEIGDYLKFAGHMASDQRFFKLLNLLERLRILDCGLDCCDLLWSGACLPGLLHHSVLCRSDVLGFTRFPIGIVTIFSGWSRSEAYDYPKMCKTEACRIYLVWLWSDLLRVVIIWRNPDNILIQERRACSIRRQPMTFAGLPCLHSWL